MRTTYVLDTNVLLNDANSIFAFGKNDIVIPAVVVEELDTKKNLMDELGRNARQVSRILDGLREEGQLHEGVSLHNGGTLKVIIHNPESSLFSVFNDTTNDTAIISVAKDLSESNPNTVLVSKDTLVRIKADIVEVKAENYQFDRVTEAEDDLYKGYTEIMVDDELIDNFYKNKHIKSTTKEFKSFPDNHYFILKSNVEGSKKSAICRKEKKELIPLYSYVPDEGVFNLRHKNVQQLMALDLLMNDNIPLVTLSGKAGSGKTLISLAVALCKTLDEQKYTKVLVARPVVPMGKDLGYLPGEIEDKLRPWMQPIYDNLEFLFDCKTEEELNKTLIGYEKIIKVEALTYIRGRSIPRQFIIIDEAQNLTKHEVKTITTRIGQNSKIVLVGDPNQIDSPYLDMYSNGLTHIIESMKSSDQVGHITLLKGERSDLAQLCADML